MTYYIAKARVPFLVYTGFLSGLLGLVSGMLIWALLGISKSPYYVLYLIYSLMLFDILFSLRKINFGLVPASIYALLVYIFFITCFLTYSTNSKVMILIGLKGIIVPFLLLLYYILRLDSEEKLNRFLRLIVWGCCFAAVYSISETVNKYTHIFPILNKLVYGYVSIVRVGGIVIDSDVYAIWQSVLIRPVGILFNYTNNGFLLASGLLIALIAGVRVGLRRNMRILCLILLYSGVISSTSRQNIFLLHFVLIWLLFTIGKISRYYDIVSRQIRSNFRLIVICSFLFLFLGLIVFKEQMNQLVLSNLSTSIQGSKSLLITWRGLMELPEVLATNFSRDWVSFFWGVGFWDSGHPGTAYKFQVVNELHFLSGQLLRLGLLGFLIYWAVFFNVALNCLKKIREFHGHSERKDLFILAFSIFVLFAGSLFHYSPLDICTNFIIALVLFIGVLGKGNFVSFWNSRSQEHGR